ncbi:phage tail tape measure protein [Vagococcus vulneris]|nr:phage tail tape measure protein [Vagococcus vulneris]
MVKNGKLLGNMVIDLKIDDTAFRKGLEGSKQATRYWMSEMKASMKIMDTAGDKIGLLKSKQEGLTKVIEVQKEKVAELQKRYKGSYDEQGKASAKTLDYARDVRNAEAQLASFEKQLDRTTKELKISQSSLVNSGKVLEGFGKTINKQGKAISSFGSALTKAFSVPVGALIGGSIKAASDFESAFAGVRKTVDASEGEFQRLSNDFRKMSKEIPVSSSALAELGESAGQLGIKTPNIKEFVRVVADLGVATNIVGEEGAQELAKFANITQMSQKDFSRLGSSLVALGNNFSTTESDIMDMSMRLAGAGHQIGMSQSDILGLATSLSSLGIEAEMGGSAISKVMINMKVATVTGLKQMKALEQQTGMTRRELELMKSNDGKSFKALADSIGMTTDEMSKVMKASKDLEGFSHIAGMTAEQFKQAFEKDAVGAIGSFINGLGHAEEKGTSAIELLDEMGIKEVRLRDSLLRAGGAQKLFGDSIDTSNKAWKENTALTKEAETRYGTFKSQLDIFKNKLTDIGIDLGGPFMAAVNDALDALTPFLETISNIAKSFADLPKSTQSTIVQFTAIALAIGPVTWVLGKLIGGFGAFFATLGSGMSTFGKFRIESNLMTKTLPNMMTGFKSVGSSVTTFLVAPFKLLGTAFTFLKSGFGSVITGIGTLLTQGFSLSSMFTGLIGILGSLLNPVTLIIAGIAALAGGIMYLNSQTGSFSATLSLIKDSVFSFFSNVYEGYIKPAFDTVTQAFMTMITTIKAFWDEYGAQIMQALSNFFQLAWAIIQPALGFWTGIFSATFSTIVNLIKIAWDTVIGIFSGVFKILGGLIKVFTGVMTGDWKLAWNGMVDIAKGGWNTIASGIEGFANAVLAVIGGLANGIKKGIIGAINGIIKAVNWVLEKFGADGFDEWEVKEIKVAKVRLPKFATGSDGLPFDTLGVVNDQKGSTHREMIVPPKGQPFIPRGRDVVLPMEKGTQIIPANMTKDILSGLPHFKNGFFGNVWEGTKNTVGKLWGKVKEFTGDIWDYVSNPGDLVKLAVNKFTNIPEFPSFWMDIATGSVKHLSNKMIDFVKEKFTEFEAPGGFDGNVSLGTMGVYQYLVDVAKDVMAKFPGMSITSGYRPGDPYYHGRHQAIDIAYPSGMNGSSKYFAPANYAFSRFPKQVAYVITQGMVRDRMGLSGTGSSGKWVRWPDNDHYDHLHINGSANEGDIVKNSGGGSGGSGQWASLATRALKMEGQFSTANLNAMMRQIQTESGGNPRAINNWDINAINGTPSKGLLQVIDPTFRAYARPGFNKNVYDPLSNMLASIRYAVSRYGSLTAAYRGVGYENGGLITREHLAMVGEGNKPEMVIPLTRESRAIELINRAKTMLGISDSGTTVVNNNVKLEAIVERLEEKISQQGDVMIKLLEIIASKNLNIDGKEMSSSISNYQGNNVSKLAYGKGVL